MRRQLGQVSPTSTAATVLFQPLINTPYSLDLINIANVGTTPIKVSLFHDRDGTTYTAATALMWQCEVLTGGVLQFEIAGGFADYLKAGSFAVQTDVANSATFTCYGEIAGERV